MIAADPFARGSRWPLSPIRSFPARRRRDFALPGVDGKTWTRDSCRGPNGLLVAFICNHCPYVQAVIERIVARRSRTGAAGHRAWRRSAPTIRSPTRKSSFELMGQFARRHDFPFPYLYDGTQGIARAYGAVCTPDFFGFKRAARTAGTAAGSMRHGATRRRPGRAASCSRQ